MLFQDLNLNQELLKAIKEKGYKEATPIQVEAIPAVLNKKDVLACAQTGTGKTAAFAIPILQNIYQDFVENGISDNILALILVPTRELALQIGESFESYGLYTKINIGVVFGGITPKQHIKVLKRKPTILVATPGRLVDLIEKKAADLSFVKYFVLDEADRMLDFGMEKDVKKITALLGKNRQNLLFSATLPTEVKQMVKKLMNNPVPIQISKSNTAAINIVQEVYFVEETEKTKLLLELLQTKEYESVLIFTRTKKKADKICKAINLINIRAKAIHSDKNQSERQKNLQLFKNKEARILVATDIAARGIDIEQVSYVINMDIPQVAQNYVHRIGRTGRAGFAGRAISFCSQEEKDNLKNIEEYQKHSLEINNQCFGK